MGTIAAAVLKKLEEQRSTAVAPQDISVNGKNSSLDGEVMPRLSDLPTSSGVSGTPVQSVSPGAAVATANGVEPGEQKQKQKIGPSDRYLEKPPPIAYSNPRLANIKSVKDLAKLLAPALSVGVGGAVAGADTNILWVSGQFLSSPTKIFTLIETNPVTTAVGALASFVLAAVGTYALQDVLYYKRETSRRRL